MVRTFHWKAFVSDVALIQINLGRPIAPRYSSGDGEAPEELLAREYQKGHDGHYKTALEARLLDDPDTRCLEQFGG